METAKGHLEPRLVKRYVSTKNKKADCGHNIKTLYMCVAHEVFPGEPGNPKQAFMTLLEQVHKSTL